MNDRKPIGYLMGLPIYESDLDFEQDEHMTAFFQSWNRLVEQKAAAYLGKTIIVEGDEVQC